MTDLELALKRIEELESRCIGLEQYASQLKKENVRIEDLEQKNKVLVEGVRDVIDGFMLCYDDEFIWYDNSMILFSKQWQSNDSEYDKIKAMLELVEEQE